jgi:hypothetical protein
MCKPGGDVIHYQNGDNRDDIPVRYTVTMLCQPGKPMLTLVEEDELARRKNRRAPRELTASTERIGVLSNQATDASDTPIVPAQRAPFALTRPESPLLCRWIEAKG